MADADQIQRLRVMCELLETEATYVKEITALVASVTKLDWEVHDPDVASLLSDPHVASLFTSLRSISTINSNLYKRLKKRIEKGGTTGQIPRIGDIVSHYAPLFHIYAEYAKLHQRASEKLFSSLTADLCSKYGLSDRTMNAQMILPIQRVPRYELLLKEIVKKIGGDKKADLEEKAKIEEALISFKDANTFMNESIASRENREKLLGVMRSINSSPVSIFEPGRIFIKSGYLTKLNADFEPGSNSKKKYMFFLFSDYIMYCADTMGTNYKYHKHITINDLSAVTALPAMGDVTSAFAVFTPDRTFIVCASNDGDRDNYWIPAILEAKNKHRKASVDFDLSLPAGLSSAPSSSLEALEKEIKGIARLNVNNRQLVHHGYLMQVTTVKMISVYLFSDILVIGVHEGTAVCIFKTSIPLHSIKVVDIPFDPLEPHLHAFTVSHDTSNKKGEVFVLSAATADDKLRWLAHIQSTASVYLIPTTQVHIRRPSSTVNSLATTKEKEPAAAPVDKSPPSSSPVSRSEKSLSASERSPVPLPPPASVGSETQSQHKSMFTVVMTQLLGGTNRQTRSKTTADDNMHIGSPILTASSYGNGSRSSSVSASSPPLSVAIPSPVVAPPPVAPKVHLGKAPLVIPPRSPATSNGNGVTSPTMGEGRTPPAIPARSPTRSTSTVSPPSPSVAAPRAGSVSASPSSSASAKSSAHPPPGPPPPLPPKK